MPRHSRMSMIESLEQRTLFATLIINGTGNNDIINLTISGSGNGLISWQGTVSGSANDVDYSTIEINGLGGNDTFQLNKNTNNTVTVNGGEGDDSLSLAIVSGSLDQLPSPVIYNGDSGTDSVFVDDDFNSRNDGYNLTSTAVTRTSFGGLTFGTTESVRLFASTGSNNISINESAPGVSYLMQGNAGTDTYNVVEASGVPIIIDTTTTSGSTPTVNAQINSDGLGAAAVNFGAFARVNSLNISAGGVVIEPNNVSAMLIVKSLTIQPAGVLDLKDADMIVDYSVTSPIDTIRSLISQARDGGTWFGSGISSTRAQTASPAVTTLGVLESAEYKAIHTGDPTFDGILPDDNAVLVKYTYYGDTDLSGQVDFDDYVYTDAGFNGGLTGWLNGDLDGNGSVDFDDYVLMDFAFNSQTGIL